MGTMKIYTYEELALLTDRALDILVAKAQGARIEYPEGWSSAACCLPGVVDIIPRMKVRDGVALTEEELWESFSHAPEFLHPSANGHAAMRLFDDLVSPPETGRVCEVTITVNRYGCRLTSMVEGSAVAFERYGKPSVLLPRAITIAWLLKKQMEAIPFKHGDRIQHDDCALYFENIDPDDPTVAWATDEFGADYELKTTELVKA